MLIVTAVLVMSLVTSPMLYAAEHRGDRHVWQREGRTKLSDHRLRPGHKHGHHRRGQGIRSSHSSHRYHRHHARQADHKQRYSRRHRGTFYYSIPVQPVHPYIYAAPLAWPPRDYARIPFNTEVYYYHDGVFYIRRTGDYVIVPPPEGVVVRNLPSGSVRVLIDQEAYYFFNGVYYQEAAGGYRVVDMASV